MRARIAMCAMLWMACQSGSAVGTPCSRGSDCATGTCEFGRCRAQCRINRDCASGATCFIGTDGVGACSLDVDLGCETGIGRTCASGLVCIADRCEQSCDERSDCPSDADCRMTVTGGLSICVDERGDLDGGASDAGLADASADAGPSCSVSAMCFQSSGVACVVDCMGGVWCWGQDHGGRLGIGRDVDMIFTTPSAVVDVMHVPIAGIDSLACGETFTCAHVGGDAARHPGHVLCWGYDGSSNIAGSTSASAADLSTAIVGDAITVVASSDRACTLDGSDGSVLCFGVNEGVIDPSMPSSTIFRPAVAPLDGMLPPVATLDLSENGACAILRSGFVQCWGQNRFGQAGRTPIDATPGTTEPNVTSAMVSTATGPLHDVAAIALGQKHSSVLVGDPSSGPLTLMTWGGNDFGENGETLDWTGEACDDGVAMGSVCRAIAQTPSNAPTFLSIASDGEAISSCGIDTTHHVLCWGNNLNDACGVTGDDALLAMQRPVLREADMMPLDDARTVFVGAQNGCAVRGDGSLWCWGANADGQLARTADAHAHLAVEIALPFR